MSEPLTGSASPPSGAGLCGRCEHARVIVSGRGSRFVLCGRSRTDPHFARYPTLPVMRCDGYDSMDAPGSLEPPPGQIRQGGQ